MVQILSGFTGWVERAGIRNQTIRGGLAKQIGL
jgi:hypothetical protein